MAQSSHIMEKEGYVRNKTGSDGMAYQRKIAMKLALNATLKKSPFKLATEMKQAEKFDDVVMHVKDKDRLMFIQVKHTQNKDSLTAAMLFEGSPRDCLVAKYFESYCIIRKTWKIEGEKHNFILLTNRGIDESLKKVCEEVELDELMDFSKECKHYKPMSNTKKTQNITNSYQTRILDLVNAKFRSYCVHVRNAFQREDTIFFLENKTPLRNLFTQSDGLLKLKEIPSDDFDRDTKKLFDYLKKSNCHSVSIENETLSKFIQGDSHVKYLPISVDKQDWEEFIRDFVISTSQPSDDEISKSLCNDIRIWMKKMIPPDEFAIISLGHIKQACQEYEEKFKTWEKKRAFYPLKKHTH